MSSRRESTRQLRRRTRKRRHNSGSEQSRRDSDVLLVPPAEDGVINNSNVIEETHPSQTNSPPAQHIQPTEAVDAEVVLLEDTLPNIVGADSEIIDLTADDSFNVPVVPSTRNRRERRRPETDDSLLVAVRTTPMPADTDVVVIEKENCRHRPPQSAEELDSPHESLTPKRKMLSCPICMDHERTIRRTGRQMMSTMCGHIFCNDCINASISSMKCCPTCRKKLTKKTGIHPIFV